MVAVIRPAVVGTPTQGFSATATNTVTVAVPSGVADGDLLVAMLRSQSAGATADFACTGWTRVGPAFLASQAAGRTEGIYVLPVPTAATLPASYTFTFTGTAGRTNGAIFIVRGADISSTVANAVPYGSTSYAGSAITNGEQLASYTVSENLALNLILAGTDVSSGSTNGPTSVTAGPTQIFSFSTDTVTTSSRTLIAGYWQNQDTGSTPVIAATWTATPAGPAIEGVTIRGASSGAGTAALSGAGTLAVSGTPAVAGTVALSGAGALSVVPASTLTGTVALAGAGALVVSGTPVAVGTVAFSGSGAFAAHATTPLEMWLASSPLYVAHRGGSADWDQLTMYAYDRAAAWSATVALEAPVWKSADGVWVINHDSDPNVTGSWANPGTGTIPTRNWVGDLQNLVSAAHGSPMIRLVDLLAKYGNTRIIWVEDKGSQDVSGFLNLLDSYAGATRYVVKQAYDNAPVASAAHARGYKTWGYYFNADAGNLPSTQANWDLLGMQWDATTASWSAATSYGKPVLAHVVATAAAKTTAQANGASGFMTSGVQEVVPQTPALVALTGVGTLTVQGAPVVAGVVPLSGAGSLAAGTGQISAGTAVLAGTGALTVAGRPVVAVTIALGGTGLLQASGAPTVIAVIPLAGGGVLALVTDARDITVLVAGPYRNAVAVTGPTRNPLTVSGATT